MCVLAPDLRATVISGPLLTFAIGMGGHTIAGLLQIDTLPVCVYTAGDGPVPHVTAVESSILGIASGRLASLPGPSGCRKATARHIVAVLEWPESGELMVGGEMALLHPAERRETGIVSRSLSLPSTTATHSLGLLADGAPLAW